MSPVIRNSRGQIVRGSGGLHVRQEPQEKPDASPGTSFDDDLIAAANSWGRPQGKHVGRKAWCEFLARERPVEFSQLLRAALSRKAEVDDRATIGPVSFAVVPCPADFFVPADEARAAWALKCGWTESDEPPPPPPKPVLVARSEPVDDDVHDTNVFVFGGGDEPT